MTSTRLLDTSVIIRYLTLDPPHLEPAARQLIDTDVELTVSMVAIAEAAIVLIRVYGMTQTEAVELLIGFLSRENITVLEVPGAISAEALELCRPSRRVSVADALIWATARAQPDGTVYTFDRRFPPHGIELHVLPERAPGI